MRRSTIFIGSGTWDTPGFGDAHPLAIPRVASVVRLCEALGWLPPEAFRASPHASIAELASFHSAAYVAALAEADATGIARVEIRERFGIGTRENPLFPGVFARAAAAVGGSRLAADLAMRGHLCFHPEGGTHHGRPDRASGFCYFNDPVFAVRRFLERGVDPVLYVDLDAHHGDGVQDAFRDEPRVHTVSIHERGRWPYTGAATDRGGGRSWNFPVPAGFHDAELELLMREAVLRIAARIAPAGVVIVCGTDGLAGDPLSGLALGNSALWDAVLALVAVAPAAVVLGGGGYNPWTLARAWTGLWARLSGRAIPESLPDAARQVLANLGCDLIDEDRIDPAWLTTLADAPRPGAVRAEVRGLVPDWEAVTT
ncbi:MAG: acetoin utilization protein AcuC [Gammaproteobacteria bacterium]|nr:acetoin utilization protein AcuC [Gammaproteobacteria bacterium]